MCLLLPPIRDALCDPPCKSPRPRLPRRAGRHRSLEADLRRVIHWARKTDRCWAFSLSNAGARYTTFLSRPADLSRLDWGAIATTDFRDADVRGHKQAEFLVHDSFPIDLVDRIGVCSASVRRRACPLLAEASHKPVIEVCPEWYY